MKKGKGFTLIELLVVITIIGILAVGGLQIYTTQIQKARDSSRVKDIQTLHNGVTQYVLDNGRSFTVIGADNETKTDSFRGYLENYIPNIYDIYDKKTGETSCTRVNGTKWECIYGYVSRNNGDGFKVHSRFESKSNVCATGEKCLARESGAPTGQDFVLGTALLIAHNDTINNTGVMIQK